MKRITVNASTAYEILIGEGLLTESGSYCKDALGKTCKLCVVSDDNVALLYLDMVQASLIGAGFEVISCRTRRGCRGRFDGLCLCRIFAWDPFCANAHNASCGS